MHLQLSAQLAYANGVTHVVHHVFDQQGGTLGRDPHCQMVLPDPFRRISRIQAQVFVEDDRFILLNASTSNAIYVDDRELRPGEICPVEKGASWVTGNYTIVVQELSLNAPVLDSPPPSEAASPMLAATALARAPDESPAPSPPPQPALSEPQEQRHGSAVPAGPFADLLSSPLPQPSMDNAELPPVENSTSAPCAGLPLPPSPPSAAIAATPGLRSVQTDPFADLLATPVSEPGAAAAQAKAYKGAILIPEDFNVLAPNGAEERNADDPLAQIASDADLPQMLPVASMDAIYQPGDADIAVMVQDPLASKPHQRLVDATTPVDPLKMFEGSPQSSMLEIASTVSGPAMDAEQALADHRVEVGSYFRPPRAFAQRANHAHQAAATAAPVSDDAENSAACVDRSCSEVSDPLQAPPPAADAGTSAADECGSPAAPPSPISAEQQQGTDALDAPLTARAESAAAVAAQANQATYVDVATPPHPTEAAQHVCAAVPEASLQALLDSFKKGAGLVDCRYPEQLTPELMFTLGKMLAESVQGCMDLLGSRAAAKQEVRVSVTLINAETNNPLKFLPTGSSVLAQIFGPRMPGFQDGPQAIADAFQDLRSHEVAMMAGTQAAVRGLFERFDPRYLQEQLQSQGRAKPLFSSQRDARLWDLYRNRYEWLKEELKSHSPASWGAEFLSAYEAEVLHSNESDRT